MANSRSSLSDACITDSSRNFDRASLGVVRRRHDAGHVGLSSTSHSHLRSNGPLSERASDLRANENASGAASAHARLGIDNAWRRRREISLLADLLAPYTGDSATQTSRALLDSHGSIASLLIQMKHRRPLSVDLPRDALVRMEDLMSILLHTYEAEAYNGPVLSSSAALRRYLQVEMAGAPRENFRVLFLDAANHLLLDRIMWEGTVSSVQAHPREIVRLALLHNATALILAHNHPSGCMLPSRDDIKVTQNVVQACASLDICVHDHLIITRNGVGSIMHS